MNSVGFEIPYSESVIREARMGLDDLYNWLGSSPVGELQDLRSLNIGIEMLRKIELNLKTQRERDW